MFNNFCQWLYPLFFHIQDASGPFLYGTLNRRPQMTLPRPRSDRLGSEGSSIMNGLHHHHPLIMTSASGDPQLTNSISAYNNQDVWTPIQTHRYYWCLCLCTFGPPKRVKEPKKQKKLKKKNHCFSDQNLNLAFYLFPCFSRCRSLDKTTYRKDDNFANFLTERQSFENVQVVDVYYLYPISNHIKDILQLPK